MTKKSRGRPIDRDRYGVAIHDLRTTIGCVLDRDLLKRLDLWRHARMINSRSEAVRICIDWAISQPPPRRERPVSREVIAGDGDDAIARMFPTPDDDD